MHRTLRSSILGALLGASVASVAGAQRVASDTVTLPTVAVTATRLPLSAGAQPVATTVITAADIRERGITRLGEALAQVPGLALVQQGAVGNVTSLFVRGGNSNYTKVLVDGVAVNAPGGFIDLANLTLDNVERIEVVRGPSSVLYGSDAISGVVQIFTRAGNGGSRVALDARAGTFGTREGELRADGGAAGARWSASVADHRTDGVLAFNNRYSNTTGSVSVAAGSPGATDGRLVARLTDASYHYPTDGSGAVVDRNQFRDEHRLVLSGDAGHTFTPRVEGRTLLTLTTVRGQNDNQPDAASDTAGSYGHTSSRTARGGIDTRANVLLLPGQTATVGAAVEWQTEHSTGYSRYKTFDPSPSDFDASRNDVAGYAQVVGGLAGLSYSLAARYDDNSTFGGFTTGRASLGYRLPTGTRVRVAAGNAFKEPAFAERFNTVFSTGNPDLRPEQTRSWELGAEQRVYGARISATYFAQRFRDLVQYIYLAPEPDADPAAPAAANYYNVAAARGDGVELELAMPTLRGLSLSGGYTYLKSEVTDSGFGGFGTTEQGRPLLRRPKHLATLTAGYRVGRFGTLSATAARVGARDDYDFDAFARTSLAAYTKVDLAAEVALLRGTIARDASLTLRVDNVGDAHYDATAGFAGPGRTVLVGVRLVAGR